MIRLASIEDEKAVRQLWKICFDDTEAFMNLYFTEVYKAENTLLYCEDDKIVASLQMLPYGFTFNGIIIPITYISGACTLPAYRSRGLMGKLLKASFAVMQERKIPLSVLIPAEDWLFDYYANYGYERVFDANETAIPLQEIIGEAKGNIALAYSIFNNRYQQKDFCVQKSEANFRTITKDAEIDGFPPKTNLSGMARVVDAQKLLTFFAKKYLHKSFSLQVEDFILPGNNGMYEIKSGFVQKLAGDMSMLKLPINMLCRLLMGYRLQEIPEELSANFESHELVMNLMLE